MKQQFLISITVCFVGVLFISCNNENPEPVEIKIEMTEFRYSPEIVELQVGQQVTLILENEGALEHELIVGKHLMKVNDKPAAYHIDMFEQADVDPLVVRTREMVQTQQKDGMEMGSMSTHEHGDHTGFMVHVPKGMGETKVTFRVTEDMVGEWEMGCFLMNGVHHYKAGMKGKLIVKPE